MNNNISSWLADPVKVEAAAWLARLQSEERSEEDVRAFQDWVSQSVYHRQIFGQITAAWETAGGLRGTADFRPSPANWSRRKMLVSACAIATLTVAGGVSLFSSSSASYSTAVGEQKRIVLEDGSAIMLDTDSRIDVVLSRNLRKVSLRSGRAHFDVAHDSSRPFVVEAGKREVTALGTAFDVSRSADTVNILLAEGRVAVKWESARHGETSRYLTPGERLKIDGGGDGLLDRPDFAKAEAWRSGKLIFVDDTLPNAFAEMNRYGRRRLVIGSPELASQRISGTYRVTDTVQFARAVAFLLDAQLLIQDDRIVLSTDPTNPPEVLDPQSPSADRREIPLRET